jgi:hypothetical protein
MDHIALFVKKGKNKMRRIRDVRKNGKVDQLQYKKPQCEVRKWFKARNIPIATEIWIYPEPPSGWEAILGAWDRVWILKCDRSGTIYVKDIQHVQGFNLNGTLIVS